jgi:predicted nucleotidyltransferase
MKRPSKNHTHHSSEMERVLEQLKGYDPEKVILFGSAARGDTDEYSDIDLIVIKETGRRFVQRLIDVTEFLPRDLAIDAFVYTPKEFDRMVEAENPLIEQALKDGVVVYEKAP